MVVNTKSDFGGAYNNHDNEGKNMNIKRAKEEIEHTVKAYLAKDALGEYAIPAIRQRPILLMGPPGIGKTQVMEQAARECGVALVRCV